MSSFVLDPFLHEACRIQKDWYQKAQAVEHTPHLTAKAQAEQLVAAELERQRRVTALQTRAHTQLCQAQQAVAQHLCAPAAHLSRAERRAAERQLFELECCEAALEQLDQKTYLMSVVPAGIRRMEDVPGWVGSAPDELTQHPLERDPIPGEMSASPRVPRRDCARRLAA